MSTTIELREGGMVGVAVGPIRHGTRFVRLELRGARVGGPESPDHVFALLAPGEARRVALEILSRVGPG